MSVIVVGMELPKSCAECALYSQICPFARIDYWRAVESMWFSSFVKRPDWCPLKECGEDK